MNKGLNTVPSEVRETLSYLAGYYMASGNMSPKVKALELSEPHFHVKSLDMVVLSKDMTQKQIEAFRLGVNEYMENAE